jgi:hypothetical protein
MSRCPNPSVLERLLEEQLGEDEAEVALHVAGCVRCQAALEQLTADPAGLRVPLTATRDSGVE